MWAVWRDVPFEISDLTTTVNNNYLNKGSWITEGGQSHSCELVHTIVTKIYAARMSVSMSMDMSMDMSTIGDETIDFNRSLDAQPIDEDTKKEVLALLKSRSITQIKDYLLGVNRRLSETNEQFNSQLKIHYTVILKVIQDIAALHSQLGDIDKEFRDLCFNDDLYQIHKLPNFEPVQLPNEMSIHEKEEMSSDNNKLVNVTLRVSNWILAVTNFIDRFTSANENSSSFFDDMLTNTIDLSNEDTTQYERYQSIIRNKSTTLQKYVVEALSTHRIQLELTQNIQLFNLFHDTISFYQWDAAITKQYNDLLYDMILDEHDIEALYGKDKTTSNISSPVVQTFLQSPIFKSTVVEKLVTSIENQLNQLESTQHMANIATDTESVENSGDDDEDKDIDEEISDIINDSISQSMGLISKRGVSTYQSIQSIIHKLSNLEDIGVETTRVQSLRQRLLDCLQKHESQVQDDVNNQYTGTNTNDTVQQILNNYNKSNLEQLMKKQIISLQR